MIFSLILLFELTLIILSSTERVKRFLAMLIVQGVLLFGIAYLQLKHINTLYLVFILVETIIMKALLVPLFLNQMRKKNKFNRLAHSKVSTFVTVMAISAAIVSGFLLSSNFNNNHLQATFLSASIASIITGIYFVMVHRNIFTHLVGFLIMENGVFLFSLAVGSEMPMLVNTTILLDIFVGVLVLGIFVNRVGDRFEKMHVDDLAQLKD